jgi:predicted permease
VTINNPDEVDALLPLPPVTFHILLALSGGERHGYAIIQDVAARTGGAVRVSAGTLYRSIQRMQEQGLIAESRRRPAPDEDDERRRYYALTTFGEARARERLRAGEGVMRLYRLLLRCYPASFRHEYGEEMARLFAERRRAASIGARTALWVEAVGDALSVAPRTHLDILRQDLRYTWRTLSRTPGFAVAATLVMALGIGATTAVFSVTDRALLRPLPFAHPQTLVRVWENVPGYSQLEPSPANYRDWTQKARSFAQLEAHTAWPMNMLHREPERVAVVALTAPTLPMLGVQPALGRLFTDEEARLGGPAAAILSDGLWRRSFGADTGVLGTSLRLDDATYTIVGVMPPDFYYPDRETELWVPLTLGPSWYEDRDNNFLRVTGRLRPDVTLEQARHEMDAIMAELEQAHPRENAQTRATVRLLSDQVSRESQLLIRVLTAASICLLLIACTNLASLLLTRFSARRHELTVRAALGAGRERLTRQLLTESLVLALLGGAAGVVLAYFATPLLVRLVPTTLPVPDATALDPRVLLFAAVVTIGTGIAFGMLPAWRISRGAQAVRLREGVRGGIGRRDRLRSVLVAAQVAVSILLLVSTGLFVRALARVQATDPGFDASGVLTLRTALPTERYRTTASRAQFYARRGLHELCAAGDARRHLGDRDARHLARHQRR